MDCLYGALFVVRAVISSTSCRSAHSFLPLRIGGFYNPEELSMNSDQDFPLETISKVKRLTTKNVTVAYTIAW